MPTTTDTYRRLYSSARRLVGDRAEAEDLLQDALLAALKAGRMPLSDPADQRWLAGVLRNQAAMRARTGARRTVRERAFGASIEGEHVAADQAMAFDALLAPMPPAARAVAVLILHGLNADEIRWIHRLSDTAFRQRLTSIRKSLKSLPEALRGEALATALHRPGIAGLELGLIRRALRATLERMPGVGSHDPDGHLILISPGAHRYRCGGN
jgi:RNA polymerase sigma factor (sigma-70 family)